MLGERFGWCQTKEKEDSTLNKSYDYAIESNPSLNWIDNYRYNSSVTQVSEINFYSFLNSWHARGRFRELLMNLQTFWIQIRPHKMLGLIWDPKCLTLLGITNIFFKFYRHSRRKWFSVQRVNPFPNAEESALVEWFASGICNRASRVRSPVARWSLPKHIFQPSTGLFTQGSWISETKFPNADWFLTGLL